LPASHNEYGLHCNVEDEFGSPFPYEDFNGIEKQFIKEDMQPESTEAFNILTDYAEKLVGNCADSSRIQQE
jgi:hypothetical protein